MTKNEAIAIRDAFNARQTVDPTTHMTVQEYIASEVLALGEWTDEAEPVGPLTYADAGLAQVNAADLAADSRIVLADDSTVLAAACTRFTDGSIVLPGDDTVYTPDTRMTVVVDAALAAPYIAA